MGGIGGAVHAPSTTRPPRACTRDNIMTAVSNETFGSKEPPAADRPALRRFLLPVASAPSGEGAGRGANGPWDGRGGKEGGEDYQWGWSEAHGLQDEIGEMDRAGIGWGMEVFGF